jgi:hypothetical protein
MPVRIKGESVSLGHDSLPTNAAFDAMNKMKAFGAFMSYLNTGDKTPEGMLDTLREHGHPSTEHMVFLNIFIGGITISVENEFNCQRDIIHLARITEARTQVQANPPYVVLDESLLDAYISVRDHINRQISQVANSGHGKDFLEASHTMHSSCKATAIIIS